MRKRFKIALVVDDDALTRQSIVLRLQAEDWMAYEASDMAETEEVCAGLERLDLLLTDIRLQEVASGWDVAEHCRGCFPEAAVIYYSGYPPNFERRVARSKFLRKPINLSHLSRLAEELLSRDSESEASEAKAVVTEYHAYWSSGDVPRMMAFCHEDFSLFLNSAAPDGGLLELRGKADISKFLEPIALVAECTTVPIYMDFRDGVLRTTVEATVYHRRTGHFLESTYRQVIRVEDRTLVSSHEFHDAAMMHAFWNLVAAEIDPPA